MKIFIDIDKYMDKLHKYNHMKEQTEKGKQCANCGNPLTGKQKKYCSRKCKHEFAYGETKSGKDCLWCKKPLIGSQRKFCSAKCRDVFAYKSREENGKQCISCNEPLTGIQQKYCSIKCKEPKPVDCLCCGKPLTLKQRYNKQKYCSSKCALNHRHSIAGITSDVINIHYKVMERARLFFPNNAISVKLGMSRAYISLKLNTVSRHPFKPNVFSKLVEIAFSQSSPQADAIIKREDIK